MYKTKDFKYLLGLEGFSDNALNMHFTLYEGYVNNINSILEGFRNGSILHGSIEEQK